MTNYATFEYYEDTYKGTVLDTVSFDMYALKATQTIKMHTFSKIKDSNIPEEAKLCCCELAEVIHKHETTKTGSGKVSEKVGDYSVTFESQKQIEETYNNSVTSIINKWLLMTGLLYRGV